MSTEHSEATAAEELHPEIAGLLEEMGAEPVPTLGSMSPEGARQFIKGMFPAPKDPESVGSVMELAISDEGIPVRVYIPEREGPYSVLVYFHGGGWVVGDLRATFE